MPEGAYHVCESCGHIENVSAASVTPAQLACARFIHELIKEHGFGPDYDSICVGLGLKSKSGIHRLILRLEERGWLTRIPYRARSIRMLVVPPPAQSEAA